MRKTRKKRSAGSVILSILGTVLLVILVAAAALLGFLALTEYRPAYLTAILEIGGNAEKPLRQGETVSILTWNIGYGALGDNADFFMDGGTGVKTADGERLSSNISGIIREITGIAPDIFLIQEIDRDSARSEYINEYELLQSAFTGYCSVFANNFRVAFLPYPVPPIGKVDSGIATFSSFAMEDASRIQLPIPFSWPVSMVNLKRCLLISRFPVEGSDRQLVVINLHLEAYDGGEGRIEQTKALAGILASEAANGNYVIAGGDFNQIFSSCDNGEYPPQEGKWHAGELDVTQFDGDWQFIMDPDTPSCRSLDQPYAGADREGFQYYLIDGFIVSGNITVGSCVTLDLDFVVSDHNPVMLSFSLD